ncbi:MAG: hypothetical protein Q9201_000876 [Fulgogasparrea decipioides]
MAVAMASGPTKPLFSLPFIEPVPFVNGSPVETSNDGVTSGSFSEPTFGRNRSGYQFRGSDPESDEDDADGLMRRYKDQRNGSLSLPQKNNNDDHRAGIVKYTKVSMPMSAPSPQDSVDGYDSFENTNNKKKRKIPTSGSLGSHHSSLSAEMAHMGISPSREFDISPPELDGGVGHYYGTGSSVVPAISSVSGINGAGRGRYGKAAARMSNERSPLGVSTNGSNALQAGRQLLQKQDITLAGQQSAKGSTFRPSPNPGIISTAIANATSLPSSVSKGQENVSLLEQHASKKPSSSRTQFTFTCGSDSAKNMAWQEQASTNTANLAYNTMAPLNPMQAQAMQQSRDFATQGTQTSPNMATGPKHDMPPQAPNQEAQQPPKKPRRSLAKQLALAARQRRLQQEYDNYHHPPAPEDSWICEFCEYEMIFGSPPEALIRQYEIKDRQERRRLAEKRRLLEKAKMKGRKGRKGNKNAAKNVSATNPTNQGATKQRYDQRLEDASMQNQGTQSDDYVAEGHRPESLNQNLTPNIKALEQLQIQRSVVVARALSGLAEPVLRGGTWSMTLKHSNGPLIRTASLGKPNGFTTDTTMTLKVGFTGLAQNKSLTERSPSSAGAKLRVDNLHYDLTEEDLEDLFTRIGPITSLALRFDRAGRSSGTAFVTYCHLSDARLAIREFDGANAHGQPIRLTLLPTVPANDIRGRGGPVTARNPFDTAERPSRSLFDRIDDPRFGSGSRNRAGRSRSRSPGKPRRSDVSKPAPEGVDRYVPPPAGGGRNSRASRPRSPRRAGDDGRLRGGERRGGGRENAGARPRKTQEELDKEMDDYWGPAVQNESGAAGAATGAQNGFAMGAAPVAAVADDGDIDMGVE